MVLTKDGGYIVVGYADSTHGMNTINYHGNGDAWVAKLDAKCNIVWQKCYGGSGNDDGELIIETNDGGYIITGVTGSRDGDVSDTIGELWVVKINNIGNIQWQKRYGGSGNDISYSIKQTMDGGYIIAGCTDSRDGDVVGHHNTNGNIIDLDGWLVKIDSVGKLEWQKCLGGSDDDRLTDIQITDDGGYIATGYTFSNDGDINNNHGNSDAWLIKLNPLGVIEWSKCYGGNKTDDGVVLLKTKDRGYAIGGETASNDGDVSGLHGYVDDWFVKLDSLGNIQWERCYGGSKLDQLTALQNTNDKGYILSGGTRSKDGDVNGLHSKFGYDDFWIVKLDSTGNIEWQICLGGSATDDSYNVFQTLDGGYIVAGGSYSDDGDVTSFIEDIPGNIQYNWWIVKLAPEIKPINFVFNTQLQIYPNPAHDYALIETHNIKELRIIDVSGRIYLHEQVIVNSSNYSRVNIQHLSKGGYIVQAICNDGIIRIGKLLID